MQAPGDPSVSSAPSAAFAGPGAAPFLSAAQLAAAGADHKVFVLPWKPLSLDSFGHVVSWCGLFVLYACVAVCDE